MVVGDVTKSWDLAQTEPRWQLPATANSPWVRFLAHDDAVFHFDRLGAARVEQLATNGAHAPLWKTDITSSRPIGSVSADGRVALGGNLAGSKEFFLLQLDGVGVNEIGRWKLQVTPRILRLNPAGDHVWTGAHLLDAATGKQLRALAVNAVGSIVDGDWLGTNRLIAVSHSATRSFLTLANASSGETLAAATNNSRLLAFAVAPGGKLIADAGPEKIVRIRDPETLALRREFRAHDGGITALAFHPREPIVATASDDLTLRLWNFETGAMVEEMRGPLVIPISLAWSPGGKRLASIGIDRLVRVWEPRALNTRAASTPTRAPGEWESLLDSLIPSKIDANGQGWAFDSGSLRSPDRMYATVPLPGDFSNTSYHLQLNIRRLTPADSLTVFLPVAGRQTGFALDGYPKAGFVSGLHYVDGEGIKQPNAVIGLQISDSEAHQLDLTVRVGPVTAIIEVTLDGRPLFRWTGLPTAFSMNGRFTGLAPGQLGLGAHKPEWIIQAARVKRL